MKINKRIRSKIQSKTRRCFLDDRFSAAFELAPDRGDPYPENSVAATEFSRQANHDRAVS
jgi:hypothetical protein